MSTPGRGRGYTGRHHLRDPRPGDEPAEELEAVRTLAELSPRSTGIEPPKLEKQDSKHKEMEKEVHSCIEDEAIIKEMLKVDEQYAPLIVLLEQFSPGEDGIQFNRKLRHFETTVTNMCPTEPTLHEAFSAFRAAALRSSATARKLAAVGASFTRQQRQQLLRRALLDVVMEGTFAKLDVLTRSNPSYLINAANLLGDYFAEARLCNGNKVHILAGPLLRYLQALRCCDDLRAHRSLATQLMQNGRELLSVLPQELDELSISIRSRLLTPPPVSIIWLLLSADLCLNKFLPLPSTLQQFYASHLDLVNEESYSEVNYGSWKKVEKEHDDSVSESGLNVSQISLHDENDKPKLRPILGAGAGLLRQEQASSASSDNFETWTTKSNLSKRYDLNSWRQEEEKKEEEPVFNPSVLPPMIQTYSVNVPEFVPQSTEYQQNSNRNYNHDSYLQQGDGIHIQNQFQNNTNFSSQGDNFATQYVAERTPNMPEKINNEVQKSCRKPMENWRREKSDVKNAVEDPNRNRQRWSRRSIDGEEEENGVKEERRSSSRNSKDARPAARLNRRNSNESQESKSRRHVSDVPRSQKYWDHDDRCDRDYNS